jgi:hypothetical protein
VNKIVWPCVVRLVAAVRCDGLAVCPVLRSPIGSQYWGRGWQPGVSVTPVSRGRGGRRRPSRAARPSRAVHRDLLPEVVFDLPDVSDPRSWALPVATGSYRGLDVALLDRDDEDDRRCLIEAEHPWFADALRNDVELDLDGESMSPRLHISMHEVVTTQLWADNPPEVWVTAQRLAAVGYDRHVVLHMIASLVSQDLWETVHQHKPFDREQYARRLASLPDGWPPPDQAVAH